MSATDRDVAPSYIKPVLVRLGDVRSVTKVGNNSPTVNPADVKQGSMASSSQ